MQGSPAAAYFHYNQESGEVVLTLLSTLCPAKGMVSVTLPSGAVGWHVTSSRPAQAGLRLIHPLPAPWYVPILLATGCRVAMHEEGEIMTRAKTGILHYTHKTYEIFIKA